MAEPELRGERILLRPVRAGDADRLLEILREPEVAHWWGDCDAKRVREDLIEPKEEVVFVIESNGELIGSIQYYEETTPEYRHAGLDIFVATDRQGQGLGPEALRLLARHLVDERGHHRLVIDPATENARAIRAYERVGFRPVGVMREYDRAPDGTWRDALLMDMLAAELREAPSEGYDRGMADAKRFLSPKTLPPPFGYNHVVDAPAGRMIFLSGQVPLDAAGQLVGEGDFEAQVRQVFENLTAALEAADAGWSDVVKLNFFVVDIGQVAPLRTVRDEYVDKQRPPASTLVEVSRLFRDDVLVEIEAVAMPQGT